MTGWRSTSISGVHPSAQLETAAAVGSTHDHGSNVGGRQAQHGRGMLNGAKWHRQAAVACAGWFSSRAHYGHNAMAAGHGLSTGGARSWYPHACIEEKQTTGSQQHEAAYHAQ